MTNDDDDEELPTFEQLFLNDGLYRERHLLGDWSFVKRLLTGPDLQFDIYCVHCKCMSTFREKTVRGGGAGMRPVPDEEYLKNRTFAKELFCQRNNKHMYSYVFEVDRQTLRKIGQSPSIADLAFPEIDRFESLLDEGYLRELKSALGLFAHGVGIGSYVYLRRVFEKLIEEARTEARAAGEQLPEAVRLEDKIESVKNRLPTALVKYQTAYGALSVGIHNLNEETCLRYFPVLKGIIFLILENHLDAKNKKRALSQLDKDFNAMNSVLNKKPSP